MSSNRAKQVMALAGLAALMGLLPERAVANDRDLRGTSIPAASCMSTHAWFFTNAWGLTGNEHRHAGDLRESRIQCGLPVNHIELSNPRSDDNDISSFQVLYRDADGRQTESRVEVALY